MSNPYKELDAEIRDYCGYVYETDKHGREIEVCADPVLYDSIVEECNRHIRDGWPLDKLSKDSQYCITEWEQKMKECADITKEMNQ